MSCFRSELLRESHIVISGGVGVLGLAVVKGLTEHGARVSVNDIVDESLAVDAFTKEEISRELVSYTKGDLREAAEVNRFVGRARDKFGPINTALCHAGIVVSRPLIDVSGGLWDQMLDVNLKSAFLLRNTRTTGPGSSARPKDRRVPLLYGGAQPGLVRCSDQKRRGRCLRTR